MIDGEGPKVEIEIPASPVETVEAEPALETEAVEALADAAVEIAGIEAERDVELAEIAAEARVDEAEAMAEAISESVEAAEEKSEWQQSIEASLTETRAEIAEIRGLLTSPHSTATAEELPPMNPSSESEEGPESISEPEPLAEAEAPEPPTRPKRVRWI